MAEYTPICFTHTHIRIAFQKKIVTFGVKNESPREKVKESFAWFYTFSKFKLQ